MGICKMKEDDKKEKKRKKAKGREEEAGDMTGGGMCQVFVWNRR
jgi:hypothetical protein